MNEQKLKISTCQTCSNDDLDQNLNQVLRLLDQSIQSGAELVFFPENSLYMRVTEEKTIPGIHLSDEVLQIIARYANRNKVAIHLGSVPLWLDGKLYNSSVFFDQNGNIKPSYQKLHLFDIELEGQAPIRESDIFSHGKNPKILEFKGWSFGQTICYDIRFAELYHFYAKAQVDAILVPAAFLVKTGQAHWEVLLRARAIESQCYIIAAAQAGVHVGKSGGQRETYGRSMVIDPWGKISNEAKGESPQILFLELERQKIQMVRNQIPMNSHRRL